MRIAGIRQSILYEIADGFLFIEREIREELDTEIAVGNLFRTIEYDYPTFHLSMDCFWCEVISGNLILKEAQEARWLAKEQLHDVPWLPADLMLIDLIEASEIFEEV